MDAKEAVKEFKELGTRSLRTTGDCIEDEYKEVYEFVLSALEKQVPKKPEFGKAGFRCCPSCGELAFVCLIDHAGNNLDYCKKCGQMIDWSED